MGKKRNTLDSVVLVSLSDVALTAVEALCSRIESETVDISDATSLKEVQRELLLVARDATQAACRLYGAISQAENEAKIRKLESPAT